MKLKLLELAVSVFVILLLMILHEFPKTVCYCLMSDKEDRKRCISKMFYFHKYVDPIGAVLGVVAYTGFSKPYMYRIQNQKKNFLLGSVGILSLLGIFSVSVYILKCEFFLQDLTLTGESLQAVLIQLFWFYMAVLSGGMLLVNLFPVSVFDMGLLIAGCSARHYLGIIRNDMIIKIVLLFSMVIGLIRNIVFSIISFVL
ncbi:MAG: hypothetical protein HFJ09_13245 [Lachnospiraceae bacterium]|nr:hypothetical protein [Lachnospiraceae bacterium]